MAKINGKIRVFSDVQVVPVNSLKVNPWNPNRLSGLGMKSLVHGIKKEGFLVPLHVQKKTNVIIDGEHRWKAAKKVGLKKVSVIYLDVTDAQAKKLTLALMFRRGTADPDSLAEVVQDIVAEADASMKTLEKDIALAESEIKKMLANAPAPEDDVAAAIKGKAKKKAGKDKEKQKLGADPDTPQEDFKEGDTVEFDFGENEYKFPITFYATTESDREMLRAMFYSAKSGEYSLALLKKTVEHYIKTRPKLRKKVQTAAGAV